MENVYEQLEKVICSKVEEFENFLLQFQENFNGDDLKKVIAKKNEIKLYCTDHVLKEFFSEIRVKKTWTPIENRSIFVH